MFSGRFTIVMVQFKIFNITNSNNPIFVYVLRIYYFQASIK